MGVADDGVPTVVEHPANSGEEINEWNENFDTPCFVFVFLQYVKSLTFARSLPPPYFTFLMQFQ